MNVYWFEITNLSYENVQGVLASSKEEARGGIAKYFEDIEDLESRLSGTAKSVGINFLGITGISEDSKAGVVVDIKPGSSPWLRIWPEYELSLLRSSAVEGE